MIIDKSLWQTCKITGKNIKDFGKSGKYYTDIFKEHLDSLGISLVDYFVKYCNIENPICPCGVCNKKLSIVKKGANFYWKKFECGRNEGVKKWSEEAKSTRLGENNPMYGKNPWNKGKNKDNNPIMKEKSERAKGRITPEHVKIKQSESARKRIIHGMSGKTHSNEEKIRMRQRTLERLKNGDFGKTKTLPHKLLSNVLEDLKIKYEEEKSLYYWNFDFYLIDYDVYIEVDGDYWHSNPKFYPNGPETKSQKINYTRDISKNNYCKKNNIKLMRFWENDIITNKESIICKLKELSV
jgi:very-short-patch-repair endonuclease